MTAACTAPAVLPNNISPTNQPRGNNPARRAKHAWKWATQFPLRDQHAQPTHNRYCGISMHNGRSHGLTGQLVSEGPCGPTWHHPQKK
eukprot:gene19194-biopygen14546